MSLYTGIVHHPVKFEFYHKMCLRHQSDFTAQGQVNAALALFKHHVNNRLGDSAALAQIALNQAEIVGEVVRQKPDLMSAELTYFHLKAFAFFLAGDFAQAIRYTQRGEDRYLRTPNGMPMRLYVFRVLRLRALGLSGKLKEGENLIQVLEESVKAGSINWLDLQETQQRPPAGMGIIERLYASPFSLRTNNPGTTFRPLSPVAVPQQCTILQQRKEKNERSGSDRTYASSDRNEAIRQSHRPGRGS